VRFDERTEELKVRLVEVVERLMKSEKGRVLT
jgi:hypothetical protein